MFHSQGNSNFYVSKYCIQIQPETKLFLPYYKGATFRGGFGYTFRRLVCITKKSSCQNCILTEKCIYKHVFQPTIQQKTIQNTKTYSELIQPFVIEPPEETKTEYTADNTLNFNLILFGKVSELLPYFILVFKELGKTGMGKTKGKYRLLKIEDVFKNLIYSGNNDTIRNIDSKLYCDKIMNGYSNISNLTHLNLNFITPTRIKYNKDLVVKPEFHNIIRSLSHRISAISHFYWNKKLNINYKQLIDQSKNIIIKKSDLRWLDWERYSTRQNTKMKLGGFVGKITYYGNFKPFLPLLLLGEYTHIGKNCTFGLGKYKI